MYYFYSAVAGFLVGTALPFLHVPGPPLAGFLLLVAFCMILLLALQQKKSGVLICLTILLLTMAAGSLRADTSIGGSDETTFNDFVDEKVLAKGAVTEIPELSEAGQNVTVTLTSVSDPDSEVMLEGESRAVVYAPSFPELSHGDEVRLEGRLRKPSSFETDTGRRFPYPEYLARENVFYEFSRPQITVVGDTGGSWLLRQMTDLRSGLLATIHEHIPDPHAALTGGVLLGAADALGEQIQENFRDTGIVHVVVLSGYHVSIVAVAVGAILSFLGLPVLAATLLAMFGVVFFALLVGMTATVVRASIMAIIALIARILSRQYLASRGLALAVVGMVAVNPHILLYDPSFQLSAVATAGLVAYGDVVYGWLTALPRRFGVREMATATITAQIAVTPLLIYYTGQVSLVSLLSNLLIIPVIPVLMAAGALTAVLGQIAQFLALPFAAAAHTVAAYILQIVVWLTQLPFSTATIGLVPIIGVLFVYTILIIFFSRSQNRSISESEF